MGEACVTEIFARSKPEKQKAALTIETDAAAARHMTLDVEVMPENFEGRSYHASVACDIPKGSGKQTVVVSMPEARLWTPATPCLYRCPASLSDGQRLVDAKDVLFGYRSFTIVSKRHPPGAAPGMYC